MSKNLLWRVLYFNGTNQKADLKGFEHFNNNYKPLLGCDFHCKTHKNADGNKITCEVFDINHKYAKPSFYKGYQVAFIDDINDYNEIIERVSEIKRDKMSFIIRLTGAEKLQRSDNCLIVPGSISIEDIIERAMESQLDIIKQAMESQLDIPNNSVKYYLDDLYAKIKYQMINNT